MASTAPLLAVAVTVAVLPENETAPKVALPKESESVTISAKLDTGLLNASSAVIVTFVV